MEFRAFLVVLALATWTPLSAAAGSTTAARRRLQQWDPRTCSDVQQISAGAHHVCAILKGRADSSAKLFCWGQGQLGQTGQGDPNDRGNQPGQMGANLTAVDLGSRRRNAPAAVSAGKQFTCVLNVGGAVVCFGANDWGQLYGAATPGNAAIGDQPGEMGDALVAVNLPQDATAVSAGDLHACALLKSGDVYCWGYCGSGQCGAGISADITRPVAVNLGTGVKAVEVSAGGAHTCVRTARGQVLCFGSNFYGQLGVPQEEGYTIGTKAAEVGAGLRAVSLGSPAVSISSGGSHTCAVLTGGTLKCWGSGMYGQLGPSSTGNVGRGRNDMALLQPVPFGPGSFVVDVASGARGHTCTLFADASLNCFGENFGNGLAHSRARTRAISKARHRAGELLVMGAEPESTVESGRAKRFAAGDVVAGVDFSCVLLANTGSIFCFGSNSDGVCGTGTNDCDADTPDELAELDPVDLGVTPCGGDTR